MFGKKDDKSKLPDLPPSPIPMRLPSSSFMSHDMNHESSMPSFPDVPSKKPSDEEIKGAVGRDDSFLGNPPSKMNVVEMQEWSPGSSSEMRPSSMGMNSSGFDDIPAMPEGIAPPEIETSMAPAKETRPKDVFVRIDKFHSARKALTDVKEKLQEVDDFVRKIREIKMREEQELSSWEKDIMHIRTRVQHVSENIFEKVE
ncbi:MAG: hypothetical protein KC506_03390 [Nanoarchaeota archaeon]|nr:hypothetical protein [Nanoarchaeota archaeon]